MEWTDIARIARQSGRVIHLGRLFGLCVEKNFELPDSERKMKYRVVFQGNQVVTETWEVAIFQDMGSAPATMEAGKTIDAYGCFPGHSCEQADAEQAYIQADLTGTETWVWLPDEAWEQAPKDVRDAFRAKGLRRPVVRLRKALYGHPDAGTFWERHCDVRLQKVDI